MVTLLPWCFTHTWKQAFHKRRITKSGVRAVCQTSGLSKTTGIWKASTSHCISCSPTPSRRLFVTVLSSRARGSLQGLLLSEQQHISSTASQVSPRHRRRLGVDSNPGTLCPVQCPAAPLPLAKTHCSSQGKQVRLHYKVPTGNTFGKVIFLKAMLK